MVHNQVSAYKQTRVKTASPSQIIVMLYNEAVRQIDIAIGLLQESSKHLDRVNNAILKAKDIVTELMVSLDMEQGGEFASRMFAIYQWFNKQLVEANLKKAPKLLIEVRDMMIEILTAWKQINNKTDVEGRTNVQGINIAG